MATLEYAVTNQEIATTKTAELVKNTIGFYTVKFTFTGDVWTGLSERWAVFDPDIGESYKTPLDGNGECDIPGEVMSANSLLIGVYGVADGIEYPTIWTSRKWLKEGAYEDCPVSDYPEPSPVIETLQEEIDELTAGKVDKPENATEGNVAIFGSNNNIEDGGHKFSDAFPVGSASGAVATFSDGADGLPIKSMTVQIEPIQAGSGDPSPSNVRAISGRTKANVTRTVVNLCGGDAVYDHITAYLPYASKDATNRCFSFYANATAVSGVGGMFPMKFKERTQYTFIFTIENASATNSNIQIRYTDNTYSYFPNTSAKETKETLYFTSVANKTVSAVAKYHGSGRTTLYVDESGVFEGVHTASDFVPYIGNTYSIAFPVEAGTVYDAELTVAEDGSGTLTVTKGVFVGSTSNMERQAARYYNSTAIADIKVVSGTSSDLICNAFKPGVGSTQDDRIYFSDNKKLSIRTSAQYESVEALLSAIGSLVCVYPLETPVTYQLTAEQVKTLLGLNNIWADTGDISIEYHADPSMFVEQKTKAIKKTIAYVQNDFTAVQQYLVNDLVYVGDTLYIVTSQIAQGATMTPNTNCTETTLNAVIKSLR